MFKLWSGIIELLAASIINKLLPPWTITSSVTVIIIRFLDMHNHLNCVAAYVKKNYITTNKIIIPETPVSDTIYTCTCGQSGTKMTKLTNITYLNSLSLQGSFPYFRHVSRLTAFVCGRVTVTDAARTTQLGYHTIHGDYRYQFIQLQTPKAGTLPISTHAVTTWLSTTDCVIFVLNGP